MNHRVRNSFLLVILVVSVTLALVGVASAQEAVTKDTPGEKGWSALDKVRPTQGHAAQNRFQSAGGHSRIHRPRQAMLRGKGTGHAGKQPLA